VQTVIERITKEFLIGPSSFYSVRVIQVFDTKG